jgi:AraC-like DNA-binding protein
MAAASVRYLADAAIASDLLPHMRRVRDHIDRHYTEPLTLDQLAAVGAVSKFHLVRSFSAAYGETPIRYLTRRRVERAQDLLRAANLTVSEVCCAVGFASLGSFSARFKQLVGETPTGYRDRWARTGAPHIPGCYLFIRGVVDLRTTGRSSGSEEEAQSQRSAIPTIALKS